MKVLLTGGGTGGHVNPALAIAEIIKTNHPDAEIGFVGTEKGIENRLVGREGYPMYHVKIQGFRRSLSLYNIKTAYYAATSPAQAKKIIKEFSPDLVIGTGGYVCWPLLKAAAKLGIPSVIHESNALAGMTVRRLQHDVDVILTNFASTAEQLEVPEKVVHVGNPLRHSYGMVSKEEARERLGIPKEIKTVILSFGGSLGAIALNRAAMGLMKEYCVNDPTVMHIHSGGTRGYENARELFAAFGLERNERLVLKDYIYDMPLHMAAADVIICRAGAMTLTELAYMKKAAVLIPSPNVADNHQYKNAKVLADEGAALLLEESELTLETITEAVRSLTEDPARRAAMEEAVSAFAEPEVGRKIYEEIQKLLRPREDGAEK